MTSLFFNTKYNQALHEDRQGRASSRLTKYSSLPARELNRYALQKDYRVNDLNRIKEL